MKITKAKANDLFGLLVVKIYYGTEGLIAYGVNGRIWSREHGDWSHGADRILG